MKWLRFLIGWKAPPGTPHPPSVLKAPVSPGRGFSFAAIANYPGQRQRFNCGTGRWSYGSLSETLSLEIISDPIGILLAAVAQMSRPVQYHPDHVGQDDQAG
jgi:hypothetical protein